MEYQGLDLKPRSLNDGINTEFGEYVSPLRLHLSRPLQGSSYIVDTTTSTSAYFLAPALCLKLSSEALCKIAATSHPQNGRVV